MSLAFSSTWPSESPDNSARSASRRSISLASWTFSWANSPMRLPAVSVSPSRRRTDSVRCRMRSLALSNSFSRRITSALVPATTWLRRRQLLFLAQDEQLAFLELGFPRGDLGLQALRPVGPLAVLLGEMGILAFQVLVGVLVVAELQGDIGFAQLAPFLGLLGLALEHVHVLLHELEVVLHAGQIQGGALELAQGLLALLLVLADARGLFEHDAAFLGLVGEDAVDHLGFDKAVGGGTHSRVVEQVMDVLEAAGLVVDEVFGLAVPEGPAGDHDLGVFGWEARRRRC